MYKIIRSGARRISDGRIRDNTADLGPFHLSGNLEEKVHKVFGVVGEIALLVTQEGQSLDNGRSLVHERENVELIPQDRGVGHDAHLGAVAGGQSLGA